MPGAYKACCNERSPLLASVEIAWSLQSLLQRRPLLVSAEITRILQSLPQRANPAACERRDCPEPTKPAATKTASCERRNCPDPEPTKFPRFIVFQHRIKLSILLVFLNFCYLCRNCLEPTKLAATKFAACERRNCPELEPTKSPRFIVFQNRIKLSIICK